MGRSVNDRVRKHREDLRAQGLRPIQIWVPDTRADAFNGECERQARLVAEADGTDEATARLLDEAAGDIEGWEA
ncbi:MAG: antitoxin MazE family protein [Pseudomonadota bacterium]